MDQASLYATITQHIVTAIDAGRATGAWTMPWHTTTPLGAPCNIISQTPYRGINTLLLWATAQQHGYASPLWGTFNQWCTLGAQVYTGEKATQIVFWKPTTRQDDARETPTRRLISRPYHVFNAAQVRGYTPPPTPCLPEDARLVQAEQFFAQFHPTIIHGTPMACYIPHTDTICMPHFAQFTSAIAYYSTLGHEACHWVGHPTRLHRDLSGRFGSAAYAMEELIAELGAAFLCGTLGLTLTPRADHAQYIASWLAVLRTDTRAILTAASKAQAAVDWLSAQQSDAIPPHGHCADRPPLLSADRPPGRTQSTTGPSD